MEGDEIMQYDILFWNVFTNCGMPEAYMNYKYFSRTAAEMNSLDEDTPAT